MLQRLESFVLPIPVMIIVVQLFEVGSRLELVVQLPGIAGAIAAGAVLVMTVRWSWRSLFVVFPPHRGLWTALEGWTGMIRQGTKGNPVTIPEPVGYTFALASHTGNGSAFVIMAT